MDSKKITLEFAKLLGDPDRDFKAFPITNNESQDLMNLLFNLVSSVDDEELAVYYLKCYEIAKAHTLLS